MQVSRGCAEAAGELAKEVAARHLVLTGEFLKRLYVTASTCLPVSMHAWLCWLPVPEFAYIKSAPCTSKASQREPSPRN